MNNCHWKCLIYTFIGDMDLLANFHACKLIIVLILGFLNGYQIKGTVIEYWLTLTKNIGFSWGHQCPRGWGRYLGIIHYDEFMVTVLLHTWLRFETWTWVDVCPQSAVSNKQVLSWGSYLGGGHMLPNNYPFGFFVIFLQNFC